MGRAGRFDHAGLVKPLRSGGFTQDDGQLWPQLCSARITLHSVEGELGKKEGWDRGRGLQGRCRSNPQVRAEPSSGVGD